MNLRQSQRKQTKIKIMISGCSGSGKTYSSLLLAYGLVKDWSKIVLLDSEYGSGDLYAHLGNYNILTIPNPFSPEQYLRGIEVSVKAGMEVIIIDSLSNVWSYLLDYNASLSGSNSFCNWAKTGAIHENFIQQILQVNAFVICTVRKKQGYAIKNENGRMIPEKIGLKNIARENLDYSFSLSFDLDMEHNAHCTKDRTGLFSHKSEFVITESTGTDLLAWSNSGLKADDVKRQIKETTSLDQLTTIYNQYPEWYKLLATDFAQQKTLLQSRQTKSTNSINNQNINHHGTTITNKAG